MPARMSGDTIVAPWSRLGPATTARCGSHRTTRAPMSISRSTKNRRLSKSFSWMRTVPAHWVARTSAMDVRSAGKPGPRGVVDGGDRAARGRRTRPGAGRPAPRARMPSICVSSAEPREDEPDHAQVVGHHVEHAQLAARHGGQRDERADLDVVGPDPVRGGPERRPRPRSRGRSCRCPGSSPPIAFSAWQRPWTCGSQAALRSRVVPRASTAAITAFSVAVTLASSRKTSAPLKRPGSVRR